MILLIIDLNYKLIISLSHDNSQTRRNQGSLGNDFTSASSTYGNKRSRLFVVAPHCSYEWNGKQRYMKLWIILIIDLNYKLIIFFPSNECHTYLQCGNSQQNVLFKCKKLPLVVLRDAVRKCVVIQYFNIPSKLHLKKLISGETFSS